MDNPEYIQIDDRKYKINTDYRVVIKYGELLKDLSNVSNMEFILGTIQMFYGEEGINHQEDYERLLKGALNFIKGRPSARKNIQDDKPQEIDMDYSKDMGLIVSSIWSEYGIDITKEKIHWWVFFDLLNGLSSDCALNRVREIRTKDISKIKDKDERDYYIKQKKIWALDKKVQITKEQQESVNRFYELTGIDRK